MFPVYISFWCTAVEVCHYSKQNMKLFFCPIFLSWFGSFFLLFQMHPELERCHPKVVTCQLLTKVLCFFLYSFYRFYSSYESELHNMHSNRCTFYCTRFLVNNAKYLLLVCNQQVLCPLWPVRIQSPSSHPRVL